MPDPKKIRVRDSNGQLLDIDPGDLDAARGSGAERLYQMNTHDNPKGWWVGEKDVHSALQDGAFLVNPDDFTSNLGKEGTYKMLGPGGKQPVPIKYSMVGSAASSGYVMDPSDRQRYLTDASADPALKHLKLRPGVRAAGRNTAGQVMVEPEGKEKPGFWKSAITPVEQAAIGVAKLVDPVATPEEKERMAKSGPLGKLYDNIMYPWERLASGNIAEAQSAAEEGKAGNKYEAGMHGAAAAVPFLGPMAEQMREGFSEAEADNNMWALAGQGVGNTLVIEAPHIVKPLADVVTNAAKSVSPEGVRNLIRSPLGMTDKTENYVEDFNKESEDVRQHNKAAEEQTQKARGKVDVANQQAIGKHEVASGKHAERLRVMAKRHQENVAKAQQEYNDSLKAHQDETKAVQQENVKNLSEHNVKAQRTGEQNAAAKAAIDARQGLEQKIEQDSSAYDQRIEQAEKNAKDADDAAWDKWRDKLNKGAAEQGQQEAVADMKPVVDEIENQAKNMTPTQVSEFRDIMKQFGSDTTSFTAQRDAAANQAFGTSQFPTTYDKLTPEKQAVIDKDLAQRGITPSSTAAGQEAPVSRLHGWKGELERAVRTASDGNVRFAIGKVLDQVRKLEEDVSKKYGADPELKDARALHGPYVDTFVNSPNEPPTVASKQLKERAPEFTKKKLSAKQLAQLAHYDPEIGRLGESLEKDRTQLSKLKSEDAYRSQIKPIPEPPTPKPLPQAPGPFQIPEEPEYPEPPNAPEIKPYDEPKPTKEMPDAANVGKNLARDLNRGLRKYGQIGPWVLRSIIGGEALHMLFQGHLSTFGTTMLIGQGAVSLLTNALRRPSVIEWLQKPNAEEIRAIDQLSPSDAARLRQALGVLAAEDARRLGGKPLPPFDPTMARFLIGASATQGQQPTLDDLKRDAEGRKPKQQAAPGPQSRNETPSYTHYFDEKTARILPVT